MSDHPPSHILAAEDLVPAAGAALIGTFFGEANPILLLLEQIQCAPGWQEDESGRGWYNSADNSLLRYYGNLAHDSSAVQLVLHSSEPVVAAWISLRGLMKALLNDESWFKNLWGYTLIYHAEALEAITPEAIDFSALLPVLHGLYEDPRQDVQILAYDQVPDGWIWLVGISLAGDGFQAATVYVALSEPTRTADFTGTYLVGPKAALLMPDLIAHKSYQQIREYRLADPDEIYQHSIESTLDLTNLLLHRVQNYKPSEHELAALAESYHSLLRVVPDLESLRLSLLQQLYNYREWRHDLPKLAATAAIYAYHLEQIRTGRWDFELLVGKGRNALRAARLAIELAEVQIAQRQEARQQVNQLLLAIAGIALAVPQVIDHQVAQEVLGLFGIARDNGGYSLLLILGVQAISIVLTALFVACISWLVLTVRRSRGQRASTKLAKRTGGWGDR